MGTGVSVAPYIGAKYCWRAGGSDLHAYRLGVDGFAVPNLRVDMRIALVTETLFSRPDGGDNRLRHLLDRLEGQGHTGLVIAPHGSPAAYGHTPIVSLHKNWEINSNFPEIGHALEDFLPDVVHALHPVDMGIVAMRQARRLGLPLIASYDSDLDRLGTQWGFPEQNEFLYAHLQMLHELADLSLMRSYFGHMQLKDAGFDRVGVWRRSVDCGLFSPNRRSAAWRQHLSDGEPRKSLMIFAGPLVAEKRVKLLKNVVEKSPDCRLAIIGEGPEAKWLKEYFEGTPTLFTGYLDQGDLAEAYASADFFIHPASNDVSGTSALEAMASGLPVLAPYSCSLLDFAVHGENALLFPTGDSEQAVTYVREITNKPRLAADLSRIARETALAHRWEKTIDTVFAKYESLLSSRKRDLVFSPQQLETVSIQ
jgi:glycosyltransferase involved in cell wall biosynthesis